MDGQSIIIGFAVVLILLIAWWRQDGGKSDRQAAAARDADARHQQLLRTDVDYNLAARARSFGIILDVVGDTVTVAGQAGGRFSGSLIRVETEGELTSRITATRLVTLGVFALAARKTVDNRQLYLSVDGDGFQLVAKVAPTLSTAARAFAAAYNTRSGAMAKQPAATTDGVAVELERLAKLHADGALSEEEFGTAKARLLGTPAPAAQPEDQRW